MPRVLIVEDVPADARVIAGACRRVLPEVEIDTVQTSAEAVAALERTAYDAALVDIVLKGSRRNGIEVARVAAALGVAVVFVTGHPGLAPAGSRWVSKGDEARLEDAVRRVLG